MTQEEGIFWKVKKKKRGLLGKTTLFIGFCHCFVKKPYRNIEQVTAGGLPSDTIMPVLGDANVQHKIWN